MLSKGSSVGSSVGIYIFGMTGRMGREIRSLLEESSDAVFVGGTSSTQSQGDITAADVLLDFSVPIPLAATLDQARALAKPLVIGTTGLTDDHFSLIEQAAKTIPILQASNMSFGIAVMTQLAQLAAQLLDVSYDIEISEAHHRHKVDAPSGTALSLGEAVAKGRGQSLEMVRVDGNRSGRRQAGQIGFSVQRGGGVIGEHSIRFMGDDEILELSHKGLSRRLFARGALKAALWLKDQPAGVYTTPSPLPTF
jgi:4-hydroxy-tetrahydrodipicolinate reductase